MKFKWMQHGEARTAMNDHGEHSERIDIYIHVVQDEAKLDQILACLQILITEGKLIMAGIDDLEGAIAAETTVEGSVETLLTDLTGMIQNLLQQGTDPATAARINALVQEVTARTATLQAAVVANTPVAPTTTAAPDVTTTAAPA